MSARVQVSLVTWNAARVVGGCLESLRQQRFTDFRVVAVDCASTDGTPELLAAERELPLTLDARPANLGFSAGNNRTLAVRPADYVLFLNPDAVLAPDFLEQAVAALDARPGFGSLSPRLGRLAWRDSRLEPVPVIDSAGIHWTRNQRHLDRGGGDPDRGQYDCPERVFGVTGAAAFYRWACLADVAWRGEIWDEDFFLYREDADLAWRAAWRGWGCLYWPLARGWHLRGVPPGERRGVSALANRHSVKNRFLLRLKNMPLSTWIRLFPWIAARDLAVIGYVPLREPTSLAAFPAVARLLPRFLAKRRHVLNPERRRAGVRDMEDWFRRPARPLAGG